MNPEEGELRPQLADRIGLHVEVQALSDVPGVREVIRRREAFTADPEASFGRWAAGGGRRCRVVRAARDRRRTSASPDASTRRSRGSSWARRRQPPGRRHHPRVREGLAALAAGRASSRRRRRRRRARRSATGSVDPFAPGPGSTTGSCGACSTTSDSRSRRQKSGERRRRGRHAGEQLEAVPEIDEVEVDAGVCSRPPPRDGPRARRNRPPRPLARLAPAREVLAPQAPRRAPRRRRCRRHPASRCRAERPQRRAAGDRDGGRAPKGARAPRSLRGLLRRRQQLLAPGRPARREGQGPRLRPARGRHRPRRPRRARRLQERRGRGDRRASADRQPRPRRPRACGGSRSAAGRRSPPRWRWPTRAPSGGVAKRPNARPVVVVVTDGLPNVPLRRRGIRSPTCSRRRARSGARPCRRRRRRRPARREIQSCGRAFADAAGGPHLPIDEVSPGVFSTPSTGSRRSSRAVARESRGARSLTDDRIGTLPAGAEPSELVEQLDGRDCSRSSDGTRRLRGRGLRAVDRRIEWTARPARRASSFRVRRSLPGELDDVVVVP